MNNSFDDQLRKKWEEKHFPVDNHHRNEMLSLLKTNRRKRGLFWWFGGLAIALSVGGGIFYLNKENKIQSASLSTPFATEQRGGDLTQLPKSNTGTSGIQPSQNNNEDLNTNTASKSSTQIDRNNVDEKEPAFQYSDSTAKHTVKKSSIQKRDVTTQEQKPGVSGKENVFPAAPNVSNDKVIIIPNTPPSIISNTVGITVIPDDVEFMPADAPEHHYTYDPVPLESIFFSEVTEPSSFVLSINPSTSNFHSTNFFAEAGAGYIPGLKNEYSAGWNFNIGGGIGYKTSAKTRILLSAGYLLQNEGFNFERTSTVTQQGFGIRSNFNTLQPDKLHFIYSKLGLQYEVKRSIFSVYGGMQYLYGAQGTIVIRTVDQFVSTPESSHYAWLSTEGMRRFLFNGEVLYGYRITPRINVRAGIKYYFSSLDKDDAALRAEGYSWKGKYSSLTPSFAINYIFYGKR